MAISRGLVVLVAGAGLGACASEPALTSFSTWSAQPLAWSGDRAEIALPDAHREPLVGLVAVSGPWQAVATNKGVRVWQAPMPVRTRTLFFHRPPHDLAVFRRDEEGALQELPFARGRKNDHKAETWSFSADRLRVRWPAGEGPPEGISVRYSRGVDRENDLTVGANELSPQDMVFRSLQLGAETRRGIFLPGGTTVRLPVDVPALARLRGELQLLPPEAADPASSSDGATVVIALDGPTGRQELVRDRLAPGDRIPVDVALGELAGPGQTLVLHTEAGSTPDWDHVFFAEPQLAPPVDDPPRVVLVFIDTLRADGLSLYGYHRPTTPRLDAWAAQAGVFTAARSVAPWTLPSARAALSGAIPERWGEVPTLAERLGRAGWATAFLAGNVYLSSNFDMAEDWGLHRCVNWPGAEEQLDAALAWLGAHEHDPALLVLHLMDPHLPYDEPRDWRRRFAGDRPERFDTDQFLRGDVVRGRSLTADEQAYVRGRYDNNVAWVDEQLGRLWSVLDEDDVVVVFSDHGEEFWDHRGFEHGHTLYEELIHVPLVVRAPGVTPGRHALPVSLLDITPTVLAALGKSTEGLDGVPLQQTVQDGAEAPPRVLGFGRPLYGDRRWGAVLGDRKYTTGRGREQAFSLDEDPRELRPLRDAAALAAGREALTAGLGWQVRSGLRVRPGKGSQELRLRLRLPGGFSHAVVADDPTRQADAEASLVGDAAELVWAEGHRGTREVFLVPAAGDAAALDQLEVVVLGAEPRSLPPRAPLPDADGSGGALVLGKAAGRSIKITRAVVPLVPDALERTAGYDPEVEQELRALGYVE